MAYLAADPGFDARHDHHERYDSTFSKFDSVQSVVTPDDLYPTTIYTFEPDPIANFPQAVESDGVTGALLNVFGTHVEYLGLTPSQIADATTTTDQDLTFVNISDSGVNNVDAFLTALLEHGVADSEPVPGRIPVPWNCGSPTPTDPVVGAPKLRAWIGRPGTPVRRRPADWTARACNVAPAARRGSHADR